MSMLQVTFSYFSSILTDHRLANSLESETLLLLYSSYFIIPIFYYPLSRRDIPGEPFPKEISWYKKTGQIFKGLHNGTIENYVYTIGYYGDMHLQRPDKSSSGYYKIQVCF